MKRYDDLQYNGLILVQDTDYPCFTEDSVLLVNFLQLKKNDKVVDLGSGTGIISVLGQAKSGASFTGIEKYDALCDLARESVSINRQDISFYAMDIADAPAFFGEGAFTAAVCNPPYFSAGERSGQILRADARHTEEGPEVFLKTACRLVKNGGDFYLCYPADRLCDIFVMLRKAHFEPKLIRFVSGKNAVPRIVLIRAKKNAGSGLRYVPFSCGNES